jgi:CheY-like chemotaxis protein
VLSYGVNPKLMSQGLSLHPLAVIVALLCGSQLGGGWGLFLAVPLVAIGSVTYRYARPWVGAAGLRADEPADLPALVAAPSPPTGALAGVRVLVVDNDADARELVALALVAQGAAVRQAGSAAAALALLQAERPDMLVSDIGMPDEDGLDLIRQVRALGPAQGGQTPATALTGYASEEDRSRILAAGFQAHLSKPVRAAELVRAIQRLLGPRAPA